MNIQDKIIKTIKVILEAGQGLTQEQLADVLTGKASEEVQSLGFDQLETFGIAEDSANEDWSAIFEQAMKDGYLKIKNQKAQTITYTPEGKKFCKKPHVSSRNGEGADDFKGTGDPDLDAVMRSAFNEKQNQANQQVKSERSKRQIKLIHAIDRKIALDDFAENENIDLDEVLDDLEALLAHGKRMDIRYFVEEIISKDDIEEVKESLGDGPFNMKIMQREWGDVYNEEELRLLRYILG